MAFGYTGGATAGGNSASASVTHGQTINSGDLVVFYVNSNSTTLPAVDADAGATWTLALAEAVSGETASQALAWKVANGSEPSSYSFTVGSAQWRCIVKVFTSDTDAVVDLAVASSVDTTGSDDIKCDAIDGRVISDNAVSIVAGGKDTRDSTSPPSYTAATPTSYVGELGSAGDQATGAAHRIYTTGETFSGKVVIAPASGTVSDNTYNVHISFIESAGGGNQNFLTLLGVG